jgi:hypothetical protein
MCALYNIPDVVSFMMMVMMRDRFFLVIEIHIKVLSPNGYKKLGLGWNIWEEKTGKGGQLKKNGI